VAPNSATPVWVRRGVAIAVGVFVVQFVVVYILSTHGTSSSTPAGLSSPAPSAGLPSTGTPAPDTAGHSASPSPTSSPSVSSAGLNGPGIDEPGIYLQFTPRPDGTLDVTERVMFRAITNSVVLTPPAGDSGSAAFAGSRASLRGLQVEVGGRPVSGLPKQIRTADTVALPTDTTTLTLRYELDGTSVKSKPSTAGRALAYIRPVTASIDRSLPVQMHAAGTGTINLTCPRLSAAEQACARGTAPNFAVASGLTAGTSTVVIQLELS
jgi:hypothetical protein